MKTNRQKWIIVLTGVILFAQTAGVFHSHEAEAADSRESAPCAVCVLQDHVKVADSPFHIDIVPVTFSAGAHIVSTDFTPVIISLQEQSPRAPPTCSL